MPIKKKKRVNYNRELLGMFEGGGKLDFYPHRVLRARRDIRTFWKRANNNQRERLKNEVKKKAHVYMRNHSSLRHRLGPMIGLALDHTTSFIQSAFHECYLGSQWNVLRLPSFTAHTNTHNIVCTLQSRIQTTAASSRMQRFSFSKINSYIIYYFNSSIDRCDINNNWSSSRKF